MRFFAVGDLQLTDKIPIRRKDNFIDAEFKKLKSIGNLVRENHVDVLFLLGDVFDYSTVSLWFINRIVQEFKLFNVPVYSIVGNHDVAGRVEGVHETALGNLFETGIVKRLSLVQYINGICVRGIDYTTNHNLDLYKADPGDIILSHNMIVPTPFPYTDYLLACDVANIIKKGVVICGHYHIPFEYVNENVKVLNPGVIVRTDITEIDTDPSVLLFNTADQSYKFLSLNSSRGVDVFNTEEYNKDKVDELNLQDFISAIRSTQFQVCDIEATVQRIGKDLNIEDNVIKEVIRRVKIAKVSA